MMENPGISQKNLWDPLNHENLPDDLPIHQRLEGHFDSQKKGAIPLSSQTLGDGKSPSSQELPSGKR
jgi:hypothetical protein